MLLEHHARGLRGFARGVRNIKALDAQLGQVFLRQVQSIHQRAGTGLLRAFFGQQARQLQASVLLRHVQPGAALFARLVHRMDAHAGLRSQRVQQGARHRRAGHQCGRHRHSDVMLGNESFEHLCLHAAGRFRQWPGLSRLWLKHSGRVFHMHRKIRPVAQVAATAHHGQVDAGAPALHAHRQNVHILV